MITTTYLTSFHQIFFILLLIFRALTVTGMRTATHSDTRADII